MEINSDNICSNIFLSISFLILSGLILDLLGDIPKKDDSVKFQNRIYTVKNIVGNRINKVHISCEINENE